MVAIMICTLDFSRIMTRTTQPAHAVLFAGVLVVASSLMPGHSGSTKSTTSALLYLTCFAAHFGAQLWMTFVSGKIKVRNMSTKS